MTIDINTITLIRLNSLIKNKTAGGRKQVAKLLGISDSKLQKLLVFARQELHAPIKYSKRLKRYIYTQQGKIYFGFIPDHAVITPKMREHLLKNRTTKV